MLRQSSGGRIYVNKACRNAALVYARTMKRWHDGSRTASNGERFLSKAMSLRPDPASGSEILQQSHRNCRRGAIVGALCHSTVLTPKARRGSDGVGTRNGPLRDRRNVPMLAVKTRLNPL